MCLINKVYTAQDMRDAAKCLFACQVDLKHDNRDISKMLRQSADMMDREVGNAAAMREALEALVGVIDKCDSGDPLWWHIGAKGVKPLKDARAALSAPPRNCDKYTLAESLRKYGFPTKSKPWGEKEWLDFCEWYISEAKGETDGRK